MVAMMMWMMSGGWRRMWISFLLLCCYWTTAAISTVCQRNKSGNFLLLPLAELGLPLLSFRDICGGFSVIDLFKYLGGGGALFTTDRPFVCLVSEEPFKDNKHQQQGSVVRSVVKAFQQHCLGRNKSTLIPSISSSSSSSSASGCCWLLLLVFSHVSSSELSDKYKSGQE